MLTMHVCSAGAVDYSFASHEVQSSPKVLRSKDQQLLVKPPSSNALHTRVAGGYSTESKLVAASDASVLVAGIVGFGAAEVHLVCGQACGCVVAIALDHMPVTPKLPACLYAIEVL
eukprot:jgi/Chrzof1/4295/Cz14g07160.t1